MILGLLLRTSILFLFWTLLSGNLDGFHLITGFFCALAIASWGIPFFGRRHTPRTLSQIPSILFRAFRYGLWLLSRIFRAAVHVSKLILDPKMPIDPQIIRHPTVLKKNNARVIFGNSITLTPGTITANIEKGEMVVHRLDRSSSGEIDSGLMEKEIQKIFRRELPK